jgi:hypothetical protein
LPPPYYFYTTTFPTTEPLSLNSQPTPDYTPLTLPNSLTYAPKLIQELYPPLAIFTEAYPQPTLEFFYKLYKLLPHLLYHLLVHTL